jgi:hypothetical protein
MKFADSVWLSQYMRDNKKVQYPLSPLAPAWVVLNLQHFKVLEVFFFKLWTYILVYTKRRCGYFRLITLTKTQL